MTIVYKAAVLRSFDERGDTLEVVMASGERVEGGVMLGDKLCWDKDWHDSEFAAKQSAADRLEQIAAALREQARRIRDRT